MTKPGLLLSWLSLLLLAQTFDLTQADLGAASQYNPPYASTACNGNDGSQFPANNLFAAAGEGIWDNGAACGRRYLVTCLSAALPKTCVLNKTIQVVIVDRAQTAISKPTRTGTTMVLSNAAYESIADPVSTWINIEFQQV